MECAGLVHKICGYYYYKKGAYVQLIRSTARRHFRGRKHGRMKMYISEKQISSKR